MNLQNLLNPNKYIPIYLSRKKPFRPHSVELHLTSKCNHSCYFCVYKKRNKIEAELDDKVIMDLIFMGPKGVYFSGGGEPLMLKMWQEYAEMLLDVGIDVALITNASLIEEKHLPTLNKLKYIAVSFPADNKELYKKITGDDSFRKICGLPEKINTIIGARCVLNKLNYKSASLIYEKALAVGYDYIIFIPAIDSENRGVGLGKQEIKEAVKSFSFHQREDTAHTNIKELEKPLDFSSETCWLVEQQTSLFINPSGDVCLCKPHIGDAEYCIGNVFTNLLAEIWNSPRHLHIKKMLLDEWREGKCKKCRAIRFNKAVYEYQKLEDNIPIEVLKDSFI